MRASLRACMRVDVHLCVCACACACVYAFGEITMVGLKNASSYAARCPGARLANGRPIHWSSESLRLYLAAFYKKDIRCVCFCSCERLSVFVYVYVCMCL